MDSVSPQVSTATQQLEIGSREAPEERDACSAEEGDDSVFYSDDERDDGWGVRGRRQLVNSEAGDAADLLSPENEEQVAQTEPEEIQTAGHRPLTETHPSRDGGRTPTDLQTEPGRDEPAENDAPNLELQEESEEEPKKSRESVVPHLTPGEKEPDLQSPEFSSLPLPRKPSRQRSFNHLTSSKYSTVSYRRIRRGNTRQKVEEFECMIMNL